MYIGHMEGVGDLALTGLGVCFPVIMFVSAISALVGMGGAMDLVTGARKVIIAMLHTNKGAYKIMKQCTLPLTAVSVVDTSVTEMGVIRVTERGLVLTERFKDYTVEQIQAATEAELIIPTDLKVLETP